MTAPALPRCRILFVTRPFLRGADVLAVQQALRARGYQTGMDGVYDGVTRVAVHQFQRDAGLNGEEGVVDPQV